MVWEWAYISHIHHGNGTKMWVRNGLTFLTFLFVCVNEVEDMSISVDLRVFWLD